MHHDQQHQQLALTIETMKTVPPKTMTTEST